MASYDLPSGKGGFATRQSGPIPGAWRFAAMRQIHRNGGSARAGGDGPAFVALSCG